MINTFLNKIKKLFTFSFLDLPPTWQIILNLLFLYWTISFIFYILWMRLFRERIPKDIPFEIDWIGFLIFSYLCVINFYLIIKIVLKIKGKNKIISKVLSSLTKIIFFPMISVEKNLLSLPIYKEYYILLFSTLFKLITKFVTKNNITYIYLVINILPRLIVGINLCIDVLIYLRIENFYKYLALMLIILLSRLIIHFFEQVKEELTLKLENMCPAMLMTDYLTPEEEAQPWTELDIWLKFTFDEERQSQKSIRELVQIQTLAQIFENKQYWVRIELSEEYIDKFYLRNNIDRFKRTSEDTKKLIAEYGIFFPLVIDLSVFIYRYKDQANKKSIKIIQLIIYSLYFIGWMVVLYKNMEISELELIKKIIQEILNIILSIRSPQEN